MIAEAEQAVTAARAKVTRIDNEIREAAAAAKAAIVAERADELRAATALLRQALAALITAKDQTPDHPWTGQKVFKLQTARGYRSWDRKPPERVEAVVETFRSTTPLPGNTASYARPEIGSAFARLLNKRGEPGLRFENMWGDRHGWKLAE